MTEKYEQARSSVPPQSIRNAAHLKIDEPVLAKVPPYKTPVVPA